MSRSKAFVRALAGRVEWYGIVQNYALLITNMPKIRNLYRIGGKCPKRKSQKKMTTMVAKGKTAVSLTYKPSTKPQNHENKH
jgi:hypothetical protein